MRADLEHPAGDTLEQYSIGALSEPELAPVEEHLLICPVCQDRLSELDAYVRTMRVALSESRAQRRPARRAIRFAGAMRALSNPAWAAVLAGIAVLLPWGIHAWATRNMVAAPSFSVILHAHRGGQEGLMPHAPAGRPVAVALDLSELPQLGVYRISVVNSQGEPVLESQSRGEKTHVSVTLPKLPAGAYWIRLYEPAPRGDLLREFGLQLE